MPQHPTDPQHGYSRTLPCPGNKKNEQSTQLNAYNQHTISLYSPHVFLQMYGFHAYTHIYKLSGSLLSWRRSSKKERYNLLRNMRTCMSWVFFFSFCFVFSLCYSLGQRRKHSENLPLLRGSHSQASSTPFSKFGAVFFSFVLVTITD